MWRVFYYMALLKSLQIPENVSICAYLPTAPVKYEHLLNVEYNLLKKKKSNKEYQDMYIHINRYYLVCLRLTYTL